MEKEPTQLTPDEIINQKLRDAETPDYEVSFDPDEAEKIAFHEDALSDQDALESVEDLCEVAESISPEQELSKSIR